MDFTPTEAQDDVAALSRQIAGDLVTVERLQAAEKAGDRCDRDLWRALAGAGILGASLPEDAGGGGFGLLEQCSVLIELGRTLAPVPYLPTVALAGSALARFGSRRQHSTWLAPAIEGDLLMTVALTEPDGGDPLVPATRAEPTGAGWSLTGAKSAVPAGPIAEVVLVSASAPDGPALFAVTPRDPGVVVTRQRMVDHDDAAWLDLSDVRVPAGRRIGSVQPGSSQPGSSQPGSSQPGSPQPGVAQAGSAEDGDSAVGWILRRGTVALCAYQLGVLERALEMTARYAATRHQFDRPIGSFQAVGQRLADAYIDVQAIRLSLWNAAWTLESGAPGAVAAVATAKFWAADAGHRVAHTAVHVHGGAGIDVDHPLHRYFLAAKRVEFELAGATAQLRALGAVLARDAG